MNDQNDQQIPSFALPLAPILPFYIRHWKLLVAVGLIAISCLSVFGAWKYHEYMNEKYADLKVEMDRYKNENNSLKTRIEANEQEIARAKQQAQKFNTDLDALRRSNNELRGKIGNMGVRIIPGSKPEDAQKSLDEIRIESNTRWTNIGKTK